MTLFAGKFLILLKTLNHDLGYQTMHLDGDGLLFFYSYIIIYFDISVGT